MPTGTAPTPQRYSDLTDTVVIQQYMRDEWENTKKILTLMEYLNQSNRVMFDGSGKYIDLRARVGEWQKQQRAELGQRTFERKQQRVTYTCPYSFHEVLGLLSEEDVMFANGNSREVLTNLTSNMLGEMTEDFRKGVNSDLLTSNAGSNDTFGQTAYAGSDVPFYGLPTIFGYGAAAQDYDPDAQTTSGAIGAGDKEALPNTTYCGVSTHPINAITGVDDKANEATSPVLANWSSSAWTSAGTTFEDTSTRTLSHLILRLTRGNGADERPNVGLMPQTMYLDFKAGLRAETNQQVDIAEQPTSPDAGMYPRLFINYEGVRFHMDRDTPTNTVYVLNSTKIWYRIFPQKPAGFKSGGDMRTSPIKGKTTEMFAVSQAPDIDQGGHKVVAKQVAQLIANPRYQGAAFNFA